MECASIMRGALALLMMAGMWPACAFQAASAPCSLQGIASAGADIWLLCDRKEAYVSADGGRTWQGRQLPSDQKLRAIAVLDAKRGFVAGDGGTLLSTEDGGRSWRQTLVDTTENLTSIQFVGDWGWVCGWTGIILHSKDGGRTWKRQPTGILQGLKSIFFIDREHGWAAGWAGTILRTTNGGETWQQAKMDKSHWSLESIYFRDRLHGWAVGFGGLILTSRDGGVTWTEQESPTQAWLKSVAFDGAGRGWIVADNQALLSEDGGTSWKSIPVPGSPFLHRVLWLKDSLWAVGQFGVLRSTTGERELTVVATLPGAKQEGGPS